MHILFHTPYCIILNPQFTLNRGNRDFEAPGILRITGRGRKAWYAGAPKIVERPHGQFAEVFRGHRSQCGRQAALGVHSETKLHPPPIRPEAINAPLPAFAVDFDHEIGKMLAQQRRVAIPPPVFVADDRDRLAVKRRYYSCDQIQRKMRQQGAFRSV